PREWHRAQLVSKTFLPAANSAGTSGAAASGATATGPGPGRVGPVAGPWDVLLQPTASTAASSPPVRRTAARRPAFARFISESLLVSRVSGWGERRDGAAARLAGSWPGSVARPVRAFAAGPTGAALLHLLELLPLLGGQDLFQPGVHVLLDAGDLL